MSRKFVPPPAEVAALLQFVMSFFPPKLAGDLVGRRERRKYRILGLRIVVSIAGMRSCVAR